MGRTAVEPAHFAVLREADLIEATRIGTSILYQLKLAVLEDAILGFARLFSASAPDRATTESARGSTPGHTQEGAEE